MATLRVLSPVADKWTGHRGGPAPRVGDLTGKVVGIYDNRKPGGDVVLKRLAQQLASRIPGVQVRQYAGSMGGRAVATPQDADRMAGECHAVIGVRAD